ncbi:LysE family translocator [Allopusillimonas ginsengisoli]|uniref:LysE family translocator n=1 Tax=Allopusillimonas ginsengisoli TaxID=453575 RepID=UPI00101FCD80|nr:LysE family translocator [Allopusillimonas ginsengisoli]TEA79472.1 LysE family translocator [Allopusillimonas ginsengisoli]
MTFEFFLTALVIVASPGTGAIYTVAAGLSKGSRVSLLAAFGCTLGIVPHMLAAISGLAALLHTSAVAFQILKYLGVAYLLYMAWTMFRDRGMLNLNATAKGKSARQVIVSAILINFLNPKLSLFFFAFLPQFVSANEEVPVYRMMELSLVFMAMTFVVFAIYGAFAAAVRQHVLSSATVQTWMRRGFAAAFAGIAAQLAFTQNEASI